MLIIIKIRLKNYTENNLNRKVSGKAYTGLMIHISIMIKRMQLKGEIYIFNINYEYIQNTEEYKISRKVVERIEKKFIITVSEKDMEYIVLHLI
ncbi:PRD domain-containing protein [Acidilutibacter cellobiosedens]|jgi:transcriptional regulatory protein LevR|uniref:PRD domain-containing protein n=1 Tax=Acidilutibacter cellobiosedens TaxID=2507161 RepID=A0A410Q8U4_9FIRM|nr:PRD domain-containing protein [Acidilutibacter cellobiosedens]QAT60376.1 PRD domain-containing protein [Acidilutibacter cellobiosedens]